MTGIEFFALVGWISSEIASGHEEPRWPRKKGRSFFGGWFDFKASKQRLELDPRLRPNYPNSLSIKHLVDQRENYVVYVDTEYNVRWEAKEKPLGDHFKRLFARVRDLDAANTALEDNTAKKNFSLIIAHCVAGLLADEPYDVTESRIEKAEKMLDTMGEETCVIPVRVFISYSHNDRKFAYRLKNRLESDGIVVVIDSESLLPGDEITQFVERAVRGTDVTLSIVSKSSLLSSWVALESVSAFFNTKFNPTKKFVACYITNEFFSKTFVDEAFDLIEAEIENLKRIIEGRIGKDRGIRDLQHELERYIHLKSNIDEIVSRLRKTLCIDLRDAVFEDNVPRLIRALRA